MLRLYCNILLVLKELFLYGELLYVGSSITSVFVFFADFIGKIIVICEFV